MKLRDAIFVERLNRFVALVNIDGEVLQTHVPTSGRMKELLVPGKRVLVRPSGNKARKTAYSLEMVDMGQFLVSINSLLPNKLVLGALRHNMLEDFRGYPQITPEFAYGDSRFDFYLSGAGECYLEVKSVTLVVEDGLARFPDAPTARGTKHLEHLKTIREQGTRAGVIFVIQRPDATRFAPNEQTDPDFATALRAAAKAGVEIKAYSCQVTTQGVTLGNQVPVVL